MVSQEFIYTFLSLFFKPEELKQQVDPRRAARGLIITFIWTAKQIKWREMGVKTQIWTAIMSADTWRRGAFPQRVQRKPNDPSFLLCLLCLSEWQIHQKAASGQISGAVLLPGCTKWNPLKSRGCHSISWDVYSHGTRLGNICTNREKFELKMSFRRCVCWARLTLPRPPDQFSLWWRA